MSSVEIVEVINAMRGPGKAELLHKNFTAKIEGHPGIDALNFQHTYFDQLGRVQTCYYLPKREAELMVMSEVFPKSGESLRVPASPDLVDKVIAQTGVNASLNEKVKQIKAPSPLVGSRLEGHSLLTEKEVQTKVYDRLTGRKIPGRIAKW